MSVTLISQLKQKNNGTFPLVDANDLLGGYYQVSTQLEREAIPDERRKVGMLKLMILHINGLELFGKNFNQEVVEMEMY